MGLRRVGFALLVKRAVGDQKREAGGDTVRLSDVRAVAASLVEVVALAVTVAEPKAERERAGGLPVDHVVKGPNSSSDEGAGPVRRLPDASLRYSVPNWVPERTAP